MSKQALGGALRSALVTSVSDHFPAQLHSSNVAAATA